MLKPLHKVQQLVLALSMRRLLRKPLPPVQARQVRSAPLWRVLKASLLVSAQPLPRAVRLRKVLLPARAAPPLLAPGLILRLVLLLEQALLRRLALASTRGLVSLLALGLRALLALRLQLRKVLPQVSAIFPPPAVRF
jgi:hypothetical protein